MKIKELIEQLEKLDPELEVFIRGYEGGVDELNKISDVKDIVLNVNNEWYYGKHEIIEEYNKSKRFKNVEVIKGIIL